jgi:hypothetical protein
MEDLNDLIFDPNTGEFSVDPSMSFEEMEDLILNDDDDDSKEIEGVSFGHMEPMPKFDDLEICITQDGESAKENETDVQ